MLRKTLWNWRYEIDVSTYFLNNRFEKMSGICIKEALFDRRAVTIKDLLFAELE